MSNGFSKLSSLVTTPLAAFALVVILVLTSIASARAEHEPRSEQSKRKLLDISGLVWIEDDLFLAVSDAKRPDEKKLTRVSLLTLPNSLDGIGFHPVSPRFPGGLSSDFESATGIPGSKKLLLVESTDDNGKFQRIFLAKVVGKRIARKRLRILDKVEWGSFTGVFNVEASAVAKTDTGSGLIFIWAERNSGKQFTEIKWADLTLQPFEIGWNGVKSVPFTLPGGVPSLFPLCPAPFAGEEYPASAPCSASWWIAA